MDFTFLKTGGSSIASAMASKSLASTLKTVLSRDRGNSLGYASSIWMLANGRSNVEKREIRRWVAPGPSGICPGMPAVRPGL